MPLIGSFPMKDRVYGGNIEVSDDRAPAEEFDTDPGLLPLGQDPRVPNTDYIVIPKGRLIAVKPWSPTQLGKTQLTLADGVNNVPAGFAPFNFFRTNPDHFQWAPTMVRHRMIEVPYISSVNDAYGTLSGGVKITPYYGSVTGSGAVAPIDKGKIVKWVPRSVYTSYAPASSATVNLTNALLPAFRPRIIGGMTSGGVPVSPGGSTITYINSAGTFYWQVTMSGAVQAVFYEYGQDATQIAGEVVRVQPISEITDWMEWVRDDFNAFEVAPLLTPRPRTSVASETPTSLGSNRWRTAYPHIVPTLPITVTVSGTVRNDDGTTTALANTALSLADSTFFRDYTLGDLYVINPVTGEIIVSDGVTVNSITISYSHETTFRDGKVWAPGVIGINEGFQTGVVGTPAHLDVAGATGALRAIIY
jgi:hypothetical protein